MGVSMNNWSLISSSRKTDYLFVTHIIWSLSNLDENLIEQAITKKTKAIMVVHLYGQAGNSVSVTVIERIAKYIKKAYA